MKGMQRNKLTKIDCSHENELTFFNKGISSLYQEYINFMR